MIDPDDDRIIRDSIEAGAVLVTWDRVIRKTAGGMTPHEALEKAMKQNPKQKQEHPEVAHLIRLKPGDLTALAESGNKTVKVFDWLIDIDREAAILIRKLRVEDDYSWRAIARFCSKVWRGPWGSNQIAGMVICDKAAKLLDEDYMEPPWN